MRESVARGRDTRHDHIELGHVRRAGGDRGEDKPRGQESTGQKKGAKK